MSELIIRDLLPRDVPSYCALLAGVFKQDYGEQGLDIKSFERLYRLLALANLVLRPLRLDFFLISVAVEATRVVGTMTTFRASSRAWYQGFGVVHPSQRGKGLYKWVSRHGLAAAAARGGLAAGGEIRPDNGPALGTYRDTFGATIFPARKVYVVPPASIPEPARRVELERISNRRFYSLPEALEIETQFRGGFLLEHEARRTLLQAVMGWRLPPITVEPYLVEREGRWRAFVRVRTHWPAMIRSLDALAFAPGVGREELRDTLLSALALYKTQTKLPVRVYVDPGQELLEGVCQELGFQLLAPLCPIRTDIPLALRRTDEQGRLLASRPAPGDPLRSLQIQAHSGGPQEPPVEVPIERVVSHGSE